MKTKADGNRTSLLAWSTPRSSCLIFMSLVLILVACRSVFVCAHAQSFKTENPKSSDQTSPRIPVGYILPVQLQDSFSVENAHIGDVLQAKIAQEVPLPDLRKVKLGSIVRGSVSGVAPDEDEVGVRITFRLNQLIEDDETTSVMTNLRAIASYLAVRDAQTPLTGTDSGTPAGWATTVQIGGDIRYGDGSLVRNLQKQKVGEGVQGGVLVHIKANPNMGCRGPVGEDTVQALWVFSADACGVYRLRGVDIVLADPRRHPGEFTLHFKKRDMKLASGTALLLRVTSGQ